MLQRHWCLSLCLAALLASSLFLLASSSQPPDDGASMQADSPGGRRGRRGRERRLRRLEQQEPTDAPDEDSEDAAAAEDEGEEDDYYAQTRVLYYKNNQRRQRQWEQDDAGSEDYGMDYYPNATDSSVDGNCTHCPYLEQIKQEKLDILLQQILSKLRLKSPPRRPPGELPQILNYTGLELEPAMEPASGASDEDEAVTQKILIMGKKPPDSLGVQQLSNYRLLQDKLVYFEFPDDLMHSKISNAQLGVYLRQTPPPAIGGRPGQQRPTRLLIYRVQRGRNRRLDKEIVSKKIINLNSDDTGACHYFTFTHEVIHWLKKPLENLGLVIEARDGDGFPLAILQPEQGDPEYGKRPFLHIDIDDDKNSRRKRMAHARLDCTNGKQSQYCCRYNLVADFDLIGWDFIIQPRHYMAFFCAGDCPYSFNPATGHSKVSYVAKDNPRKDDSWIQASKNAGPCCTGVRASSLDMIYFDENEHIRFGHLKNMIVNECACA